MKTLMSGLVGWGKLVLISSCMVGAISAAHANVQELADDDLSEVAGGDGVRIDLHLEWNTNGLASVDLNDVGLISVGFYDNTAKQHSYFTLNGIGGIADFFGLAIDARKGPIDVGDYVDVTLPVIVAFKQFGFRAMTAQPTVTGSPTTSYGQWMLNGAANVTGNVYIWPAK